MLLLALAVSSSLRCDAAQATTGTLVVRVLDAAGTPIAGAAVAASSPSGRFRSVTDRAGRATILGVAPDTYRVEVDARGYGRVVPSQVDVAAGAEDRLVVELTALTSIGHARAASRAFAAGAPVDRFIVNGDAAKAQSPIASSAGLANYSEGTVQGAIVAVPGVDLDPFGNAILRGGRVADAAFEYNGVTIPQGLIAEPGGNVDGAQLPTTGVASTIVTLAGYTNESDNALGGVVNQVAAIGTYPEHVLLEFADGVGSASRLGQFEALTATPDLHWRYAFAGTFASTYFPYGNGQTFYPAEAGTYGLALQSRAQSSFEANVHDQVTPKDDVSFLALDGEAAYNQYDSPYAGETIGAFDGSTTVYPGETNPNAPVRYAAGVRGGLDVLVLQWQHTGAAVFSRVQLYQSRYASSAGGPFWDENGFPNGAISLSETSWQQQYGLNLDNDAVLGDHHVRFGAELRTNSSSLQQVVPTADEVITSSPTVQSFLAYAGDTWTLGSRLSLMASGRLTSSHFLPSDGYAYSDTALDPHLGASYRIGGSYAVRVNVDHITVAPAPLEVDRTDSTNVQPDGAPAPFVPLAPQTANDQTYAIEGGTTTRFRLTYYAQSERNLIDVLPFNFRSAVDAGLDPNGVGVPTNVGNFRSHGAELYVRRGGFALTANAVRAFSSSASQFAFNDLNAPAIAAGALFPVNYIPDFSAKLSYEFPLLRRRLRITPSLAYATGYPYGNGKMVWVFDAAGKPVQVPNDNYVNPGANYYFLANPSAPYNATSNPFIGNLGTNEGNGPNTLRSTPETFVNLHVEGDLTPRLTIVLDVANLFGNFAATAYQSNPYLIGPPGYKGRNSTYANCYAQILAGTSPCAPGLPAGATPYTLGNGVPTSNGVTQAVPWTYGSAGYVPQSYPMGRTFTLRLRYRI
jgi:hypothetical protein